MKTFFVMAFEYSFPLLFMGMKKRTRQDVYEDMSHQIRLITHYIEQTREQQTPERMKSFIWSIKKEAIVLGNKAKSLQKV